jgi:hypothetical protein
MARHYGIPASSVNVPRNQNAIRGKKKPGMLQQPNRPDAGVTRCFLTGAPLFARLPCVKIICFSC